MQDGNVEGAAAEVEDYDLFVDARFIETVSKSRRRRFVYDTRDFQARDLTRVFGRLTLSVVEVSGNRDNRLVDFVTKVGFRSFLKLAERLRGNLRGGITLAVDLDANVFVGSAYDFVRNHAFLGADFALLATHEALDRCDRAFRVHDRLTFRKLADELFRIGERDDTGSQPIPFGIRDYLRFFTFHNCDDRVGCSKIDADDFFALSHGESPV